MPVQLGPNSSQPTYPADKSASTSDSITPATGSMTGQRKVTQSTEGPYLSIVDTNLKNPPSSKKSLAEWIFKPFLEIIQFARDFFNIKKPLFNSKFSISKDGIIDRPLMNERTEVAGKINNKKILMLHETEIINGKSVSYVNGNTHYFNPQGDPVEIPDMDLPDKQSLDLTNHFHKTKILRDLEKAKLETQGDPAEAKHPSTVIALHQFERDLGNLYFNGDQIMNPALIQNRQVAKYDAIKILQKAFTPQQFININLLCQQAMFSDFSEELQKRRSDNPMDNYTTSSKNNSYSIQKEKNKIVIIGENLLKISDPLDMDDEPKFVILRRKYEISDQDLDTDWTQSKNYQKVALSFTVEDYTTDLLPIEEATKQFINDYPDQKMFSL